MPIKYAIYSMSHTCLGVLSTQYKSSIAKERFRKSLNEEKAYLEALTTAVVDFQKAQCFFMLATNIAGLVTQMRGGLQPKSFQQVYNTYIFIKIIAIGGFLPISFTLLTLHMIHKLSWYLLTLSATTIGVAAATLLTKSRIKSDTFTLDAKDLNHIMETASTGGPATCASKSLIAWCYDPQSGSDFGFNSPNSEVGANTILVFCLVTSVILIVDHFCRSTDKTQRRLNDWILKKLHIASKKKLFGHAKEVLDFVTAVFHLTFFCIYIYCFYIFASHLQWFQQYNTYESTWGFGQIVAILVWAPTLCDYFWDQARMSHGLQLSSFLLHDLSFALPLFGKLDWTKLTFGASSLCSWG